MKCPTCGYIGFETSDRCRNCGYDFGLATQTPPAPELSLHADETEGALTELDIRNASPMPAARPVTARRPARTRSPIDSRTSTRCCRISIASWARPSRLPTCRCLTTSLGAAAARRCRRRATPPARRAPHHAATRHGCARSPFATRRPRRARWNCRCPTTASRLRWPSL